MTVHVLIPGPLQPFAAGLRRVTLTSPAATVAEALEELAAIHPGLRGRVVTEQGKVRTHVNVFVGEENIRDADGLATRLPEGCEIAILPAVSGG